MSTMKMIELAAVGVYLIIGLIVATRYDQNVTRRQTKPDRMRRQLPELHAESSYRKIMNKHREIRRLEAEMSLVWDLELFTTTKSSRTIAYLFIICLWWIVVCLEVVGRLLLGQQHR